MICPPSRERERSDSAPGAAASLTAAQAPNPDEGADRADDSRQPADLLNAAQGLFDGGRAEEGMRLLEMALIADHQHLPALLAFAEAQRQYGTGALAAEVCRVALEVQPGNVEAMLMLGRVLHEAGSMTDALEMVEAVIKLRPEHEKARIYRAALFKAAGRFEDARHELLGVIRDNPQAGIAYSSLADLETFTPDNPILKQLLSLADQVERVDSLHLPALYFALGKAHDDIGDYEKAFGYFSEGARLKRAKLHYDETDMLGYFDEVMEIFDRTFIEQRKIKIDPETTVPVFIVGMPRSGSTLIERILSSHPEIHSEGEMRSFSECLAGLLAPEHDAGVLAYPQIARRMSREQLELLSRLYASHVAEQAGPARVFVNKLLGNIFFLGLIHAVMPHAKFIVMKRHPVDTCLAAFTTLFGEPMLFTYDLAELGRYYRKYEQLTDHWKRVLPPGTLREVSYEDMVADPEAEARELIRFVGLPWNQACLGFHESPLPVRTASVVQVRRPIYRSSVGRRRHYDQQLQPLVDALAGAQFDQSWTPDPPA